MVSACTLVLRYRPNNSENEFEEMPPEQNYFKTIIAFIFGYSEESLIKRLFMPSSKISNKATSQLVNIITIIEGFYYNILNFKLNYFIV